MDDLDRWLDYADDVRAKQKEALLDRGPAERLESAVLVALDRGYAPGDVVRVVEDALKRAVGDAGYARDPKPIGSI